MLPENVTSKVMEDVHKAWKGMVDAAGKSDAAGCGLYAKYSRDPGQYLRESQRRYAECMKAYAGHTDELRVALQAMSYVLRTGSLAYGYLFQTLAGQADEIAIAVGDLAVSDLAKTAAASHKIAAFNGAIAQIRDNSAGKKKSLKALAEAGQFTCSPDAVKKILAKGESTLQQILKGLVELECQTKYLTDYPECYSCPPPDHTSLQSAIAAAARTLASITVSQTDCQGALADAWSAFDQSVTDFETALAKYAYDRPCGTGFACAKTVAQLRGLAAKGRAAAERAPSSEEVAILNEIGWICT
jgi:hypothetical protein